MSLPEVIRVKLSSEAAESISITPVVTQEMSTRDLVELMLGITGKDAARIRDLLMRGSLVSGATRFRWAGWQADLQSVEALLASFPDPEPNRPFVPGNCIRAILRGGRHAIEIPREAGVRKPMFRRTSFWDILMEMAAAAEVRYDGYSYKERTDCYEAELPAAAAERLRAAGKLVQYTTLRKQLLNSGLVSVQLYVERR